MALRRSGSSDAVSPFIKPDRNRRNFLRAMRSRGSTPRPMVKKEDPDAEAAREKLVLGGGVEGGGFGRSTKVKEETAEEYDEFPLRAVAKEELENMRTHLLKFQSKKNINPSKDFHLPIRLHRKDTRNLQFQLTRAEIVQRQKEIAEFKSKQEQERSGGVKKEGTGTPTPGIGTPADAKDSTPVPLASPSPATAGSPSVSSLPSTSSAATTGTSDVKIEEKKGATPVATRLEDAGPAADPTKVGMVKYDGQEEVTDVVPGTTDPLADVAPDGGGRAKRGNVRRKTRQLKVLDENAKKLRFEEFYPWVMEDYDGYNTWVGSYEAGNSDSYVLLSVEDDGSFTMIPADKVYKFTARNKYATLTIDEAEKRMDRKSGEVPRWLMKHLDDIGTTTTRYDRTRRRLKAVSDRRTAEEERSDNSEVELDYDEEFADDEEAPIIDGNEQENKESEQRIKKEMMQANAMGLRDEPVSDEEDELFNEKKIDEEGERIKKALQKTELAALYSSDEDEANPYLSESDVENKKQADQVKKEASDENLSRKSSPRKHSKSAAAKVHREPQVRVKSIKDCIIILKADKNILKSFPKGEWNPKVTKRKREEVDADLKDSTNKRVKVEEGSVPLITEQGIIDAIGDGVVNVKEFGKAIRKKYPGPENKQLMVAIVKKLCRAVDKQHMELKK
ncbi:hypothetical protein HG536_0E04460 [Torulaspora globosa]|uniref:Transcription initiation factor IIF subunit alpha n=1 Tax=Torulaspora globosa TaxID=48254 RepID=A0A7G3ZJ49_9SACH|nr:uncharacterized protein HG536_0E04460 [Torulaspora globosa]QLL33535.1 hypothetical protein HG536_0E04460 [Torulaspora globosa]